MMIKSMIKKMLPFAANLLAPAAFPFQIAWKEPKSALAVLNDYSPNPGNTCIRQNVLAEPSYDLEIIIPCYNVEKYAAECIESVLKQKCSYKIHCTVIDDGSTDKTGEIVDLYGADERVTVIHQANQGLSGARNIGLRRICAHYITFLDSDDLLADGSLEQLLQYAFEKNADIVQGGLQYFSDAGEGRKEDIPNGQIRKTSLLGFAHSKVIKGALFQNIVFPEGYWYEDSVMRQIIFNLADENRIFGLNIPFYRYRKNENGITITSLKKKKSLDSLWITLQLFQDRKELGMADDQEYYEYMLHMAALTYKRIRKQPELIKKAFFCVFSDFCSQNFAEYTSQKERLFERALNEKRYLLFKLLAMTK